MTSDEPNNLESLCHLVGSGARHQYLFFWGHTTNDANTVGKECLSQWYPAPFIVDGRQFPTAEHYMMYRKARLFGDDSVAERVLLAPNPKAVKALGRTVRGFDHAAWVDHRHSIVVEGNRSKFGSNPVLRRFLIETGRRVLVEASPVDRIWGIGLSADDEHAENPLMWRGLNLLGFALMAVRRDLQTSTPAV